MLNYAETTEGSTIISVPALPQDQDATASTFSYVIGPIDEAQIITMYVQFSTDDACSLLLPIHLPPSMISHPAFHGGYQWCYLSEEAGAEEEAWAMNVPRLVNHIYMCLTDTRLHRDLLTDKVGLAERDAMLAAVDMAHLCFLLPLFTQPRPTSWPRSEPYHPRPLHDRAVKAYRARVRCCCEQGNSYEQAQRLALVGTIQ